MIRIVLITECIDRLIENPRLRKEMGDESKSLSNKFSIETIVNEWVTLINSYFENCI